MQRKSVVVFDPRDTPYKHARFSCMEDPYRENSLRMDQKSTFKNAEFLGFIRYKLETMAFRLKLMFIQP